MILKVDLGASTVEVEDADGLRRFPLDSPEAFALVSRAWLRAGWDTKYVYGFTWFGRPVIQLPEDLVRVQEVIYRVRPTVIVETGIAHGGSLIFYASLCKAMGRGRVIGIDIEIRPHNREAIERHPLYDLITLYEGDSTDAAVVESVRSSLDPDDILLVSVGSYIVAADGIMADVAGAPRTKSDWSWNNPRQAVQAFVSSHPDYVVDEPRPLFDEGLVRDAVTYWGGGWLHRVS